MEIDGRKDFFAPKRFMVEFFASLAIVYVTTLTNVFQHHNQASASSVPICAGLSMMLWAWLLRSRSGGVLNPAMAFAYAKVGQLPFGAAIVYALVQIIGGLFAAGLIFLQLSTPLTEAAKGTGAGIPNADPKFLANAFICELLATMFQAFVLIGLVSDKKSEKVFFFHPKTKTNPSPRKYTALAMVLFH
jgi:glycerol uptake facilitator-like aquaporin